jgi:hypothetical protein
MDFNAIQTPDNSTWMCPDELGCQDGVFWGKMCNASAPNGIPKENCLPLISYDPRVDNEIAPQLINNLGLYASIIYVNDQIDAEMLRYHARGMPFLAFYWQPSSAVARGILQRVTFPGTSTLCGGILISSTC